MAVLLGSTVAAPAAQHPATAQSTGAQEQRVSPRPPQAPMPHIQLVVVQPTPFCNINCRYCYLPDRSNNAVLADETIANLFSQVFASGWLQHGLTVVWHAGEPMVLPIDFY